ncbi:DUF6161 domain-containing protein [Lacimicrobium alkaliphilum]|uniref:DUF6161 domain-containing protein n=1 Tax=Lacimicrobium alkaliphilum TaxID=1526571 RepID=A0ABQ1RNI0_9ALTE|nr:DUF6161 domain-containing protein [Lacimicrobium alkaliphilum]GGD73522.1 hypothetical protein GCM10011357_30760 [Lacimicrobium alkaliphilum]
MFSTIVAQWEAQNHEALKQSKGNLEGFLTFIDFPFLCKITGKAIEEEVTESPMVAANMLYLCCAPKKGQYNQDTNNFVQWYHGIGMPNANGRSSPLFSAFLRSEGYRFKANRILQKLDLFGVDANLQSLGNSLEIATAEILKVKHECEESATDFELWKQSEKSKHEQWKDQQLQDFESYSRQLLRRYVSEKTRYIRRTNEVLQTGEETVEKAKDVYLSQIELDASVTYWESKKDVHKGSRKIWLIAMFALVALTAFSPLLVSLLPVPDLTEDKLLLNAFNPMTLITSVLLISLLSFCIRLCSKQYSTQQHLYLEAEERKTMLKTYLALMNEGKLVEQEDRKVALDTLFRAAQTGIVAENGSIVPSETIIRIVEKQTAATKP